MGTSNYNPDSIEDAEAAGYKVDYSQKIPTICGYPITASLSEDLYMWYLSEVKSGKITDWFFLIQSSSMKPFRAPSDGAMLKKYARLKKAGLSKDEICNGVLSLPGRRIFDAILLLFITIGAGLLGVFVFGSIGAYALMALTGQSNFTGRLAFLGIALTCLPGPLIGGALGYMFMKDSNRKRNQKMMEKLHELDSKS